MSESRSPHEDIVGKSEVDPNDIRRFLEATRKSKLKHTPGPSANPDDAEKERAEAAEEPEKTDEYYQRQLDQLRELKRRREKGELSDDDTQQ